MLKSLHYGEGSVIFLSGLFLCFIKLACSVK